MTTTPGGPPEGAAPEPGAVPESGPPDPAGIPAGRGRFGALRSRRVAVTGAIVAVVIVALAVAGATVGSGSAAPHTLGRAKNFSLGVLETKHPHSERAPRVLGGRWHIKRASVETNGEFDNAWPVPVAGRLSQAMRAVGRR